MRTLPWPWRVTAATLRRTGDTLTKVARSAFATGPRERESRGGALNCEQRSTCSRTRGFVDAPRPAVEHSAARELVGAEKQLISREPLERRDPLPLGLYDG